ncbi:hypothetical protein IQ270_03765 [Microcoleus sp. LEGE 07076]|nr:hypothetical protein [Microcoleus sp. LEGE 07076]
MAEKEVDRSEFLYSPISFFICPIRTGIVQLMSVSSFFSNIFILTSRPEEAKPFIKKWLLENQLLDLVEDIICCNGRPKINVMKEHKIDVLVDDEKRNLPDHIVDFKFILWQDQYWIDLLKNILEYFIASRARLKNNPRSFLKEFKLSTDIGASPVFILTLNDRRNIKLRLCSNNQTRDRIISFLRITEENRYSHVAVLIAVNGLAILKTYIEGVNVSSLREQDRMDMIFKVGVALAKLHSIEVDEFNSDFRLEVLNDGVSLLVFSADNYNIIVTETGEIAFIDLEACNVGSRWVDYFWAREQLCQSDREKLILKEGYFSVYMGNLLCPDEEKMARLSYKVWLTYQFQQSKLAHASNLQKVSLINKAFQDLWSLE